jgi:protein phosphatase
VQAVDYFLLCSNGMLEQLYDDKLIAVIAANDDTESKMNVIFNICKGKTRDNFSTYLIRVLEVQTDK